jgi:hypothetical protein
MTDRDDRGARRLKAAWNRLADRVRARMEHVPPLGTVLVSAEVFRRAMRENRELKARVRELEAAARAVVEAARGGRFDWHDKGEAYLEMPAAPIDDLARLLGVELPE